MGLLNVHDLKNIRRGLVNLLLFSGFIISIYISIKAIEKGEWGTIAGALAVIAAIISTFVSQSLIWKQEDDIEPDVIVFFDLDSRSHLIQLVIKNIGGSNAYDVKIKWIKPLVNIDNSEINFPYIPILPKDNQHQIFVDGTTLTFEKAKANNLELIFDGFILFKQKRTSKRYKKNYFEISLEPERRKLVHITDTQQFLSKNATLANNINTLNHNLKELIKAINKSNN